MKGESAFIAEAVALLFIAYGLLVFLSSLRSHLCKRCGFRHRHIQSCRWQCPQCTTIEHSRMTHVCPVGCKQCGATPNTPHHDCKLRVVVYVWRVPISEWTAAGNSWRRGRSRLTTCCHDLIRNKQLFGLCKIEHRSEGGARLCGEDQLRRHQLGEPGAHALLNLQNRPLPPLDGWSSQGRGRPISVSVWKSLVKVYGSRCYYCGAKFPPSELQCEHMIPRDRGGSDELANLVPACGPCNHSKGTLTAEEFLRRRAPTPARPAHRPDDPIPQ
jgi:5-methylcytosine-specific restriction endonuclease McrA